jgi:hypothetical protein
LRFCAAALVRWIQEVSCQLFAIDDDAIVCWRFSRAARFQNRALRFDKRFESDRKWRRIRINRLELVDKNSASWNQVIIWLRNIEVLRTAA